MPQRELARAPFPLQRPLYYHRHESVTPPWHSQVLECRKREGGGAHTRNDDKDAVRAFKGVLKRLSPGVLLRRLCVKCYVPKGGTKWQRVVRLILQKRKALPSTGFVCADISIIIIISPSTPTAGQTPLPEISSYPCPMLPACRFTCGSC